MDSELGFEVSRAPLNKFSAGFRPGHSLLMAPKYLALAFPQPDVATMSATRAVLVVALVAFPLGLGLLVLAVFLFGDSIIPALLIGFIGLLIVVVGARIAVADVHRVWTFDRRSGLLRMTPRVKGVGREVQLADIAAVQVLVADSAESAYETNLVLNRPAGKRLAVMCHVREPAMRSDAEKLAAFLRVPLLDHTGEPAVIKGHEVQIQRVLLDGTISSGRSMVVHSLGPRRMVLEQSRGSRAFRIIFTSLGVFGIGIGVVCAAAALRDSLWWCLGALVMCSLVGMVFILLAHWTKGSPIIVDRFRNAVRGRALERRKDIVGEIPFRNISALQICSGLIYPPEDDPFMAFQLNLVLVDPPGRRILLFTQGDEQALRQDAERLAEFLRVPLLDHTEPDPATTAPA